MLGLLVPNLGRRGIERVRRDQCHVLEKVIVTPTKIDDDHVKSKPVKGSASYSHCD